MQGKSSNNKYFNRENHKDTFIDSTSSNIQSYENTIASKDYSNNERHKENYYIRDEIAPREQSNYNNIGKINDTNSLNLKHTSIKYNDNINTHRTLSSRTINEKTNNQSHHNRKSGRLYREHNNTLKTDNNIIEEYNQSSQLENKTTFFYEQNYYNQEKTIYQEDKSKKNNRQASKLIHDKKSKIIDESNLASNKEIPLDKTDKKISKLENKVSKYQNKAKKLSEKINKKKYKKQRLFFEENSKVEKAIGTFNRARKNMISKVRQGIVIKVHQKVHQVEHENSGVEAAHKTELVAEKAISKGKQLIQNSFRNRKLKKHKKLKKFESKAKKASEKLSFEKLKRKHPEILKGNIINKFYQKQKIKRQYMKSKRAKNGSIFIGSNIKKAIIKLKELMLQKKAFMYIGIAIIAISIIGSALNIGGVILAGGFSQLVSTSYLASDKDVTDSDVIYSKLEVDLQKEIKDIESNYPGYDEYRYNIGAIGHDPHELMAYLTAKYGEFKVEEIEDDLNALFNQQYQLEKKEIIEIRTRNTNEQYEYKILEINLVNKTVSEVISNNLNKDEKEIYEVYLETKGNFANFRSPFNDDWKGYMTSPFGYRFDPISNDITFHSGLDLGIAEGTPILSVHDGQVTDIGYDGDGYGKYIEVTDKYGVISRYAHCSSITAKVGQKIKAGDKIAEVGNTGKSTGSHLHIEIEKDGIKFNPYFYLESKSDTLPGAFISYPNGSGNFSGNPGIAFDDEAVRRLFSEAEKHIGKAYVFGANGPNNFDCSSFVCWTFTHSGVRNLPRTTAQGIYNQSTPISPSEAKAGDLVFFTGTYKAGVPVTHIGIYAGEGMMIHAGNPVGYTSINTNYWKKHFYSFGRLN